MKFRVSRKTFRDTAAIVRPPQRLRISEWAEESAWIPPEGNSEPGKFRLSRMPHEAAMLDDPLDMGVRETFWQMASQFSGKTLCLTFICEFVIAVLKESLIMSRDTRERALEWMRDQFLPTASATECMDGLLKEPRKRDSNSTALSRHFPGGVFKLIGAKSRGAFRGTRAGNVFQDEVDAYETTKEGDPCALIDRACKTFPNARKIKCSTPTLAGFSRINSGFESGDKQYYFLPCPVCGGYQWLKTEQMKFSFSAEEIARFEQPGFHPNGFEWTIGNFPHQDTGKAIYVCEHCKHGWTDQDRLRAYWSGHPDNPPVCVNGVELRAEWRATAPFKGIRSRHLNGMYASIGLEKGMRTYLQMFAEQFLAAKRGGRETLMAWTNMFKNEPFEDEAQKIDWQAIKARAEEYEMPVEALWVAFAMDIQEDRVEILFVAWGFEQEAWVLEHRVIYGDFDMPDMQARVWEYLDGKTFEHQILGPLKWKAGAVDSGHQTKVKAVYQFCAKHRLQNVWSVKGFDNALGAVFERKTERTYGGLRFNFNVDYLKTMLFGRLANAEPGARYIHFRTVFDEKFYAQLCSEKRVPIKQPKGGYIFRWVKHTSSTRNEILDLMVYAFGVFEVCREEERIARTWKEVQQKIREANPAEAAPGREVDLRQPAEKKIPGIAAPAQPGQAPRPMRRRVRVNSPFARRW
jgi:phage terminase large subunit GpA-like protein